MPYLVQYQYSYKQKIRGTSQTIQVTLFKKSSEGIGTPVITQLVAGKPAFKVNVIDNDKNKFKAIRGKQATLTFKPKTGITASTFSTGPDDEWIVEAIVVSTGFVLFKGFLIMDDHQQSFLPVEHQYDIELTATDNLGTLKEVALTDDSGNYIRDYKKKIDLIAQCLRKTGLQLDIIVRDTWMEESQTTFMTGLNFAYMQMKTFEKDFNEAVSCYAALEIICSYHLSIKQFNGQWWVENIDEKTSNSAYLFRFDYTGAYVDQPTPTTYIQQIGKTQPLKLINKDAVLSYVRPYKFIKLTFNYQYPKEILDNIDFSRGVTTIGSSVSVTLSDYIEGATGTGYLQKYAVEDWTVGRYAVNNETSIASTTVSPYIVKIFSDSNLTYELTRYVVVPWTDRGYFTDSLPSVYLRSNSVLVEAGDKGVVSVDYKFNVNTVGDYVNTVGLILKGDNGKFYVGTSQGLWVDTAVYGTSLVSLYQYFALSAPKYTSSADKIKWQTYGLEMPPVPVGGELYFYLSAGANHGGTGNPDAHFTNLQFTYIPKINGSYSKYSGQSSKIEQSGNYKANIDDRISMSDSPKKLFNGAMFKLIAGKYVLTQRWFSGGDLLNQGITPPYPPPDSYLHPFGHLQAYAVWNQFNRRMIEISGTVKGLRLGTSTVPDLIDTYKIDATTDAGTQVTTDKEFMPVGLEHEFENEEWNTTISETADSTIPKDFTTPLKFKYEGGGQ